jgi:DUF971 family protein
MPHPVSITLRKSSRLLHIDFDNGTAADLEFEYLRVYSPSAEVKGHGPGQAVLQTGKENVGISSIVPVGNYAVKLVFDDGHDTGIYTWNYLFELGQNKDRLWKEYLNALDEAGYERKAHESG